MKRDDLSKVLFDRIDMVEPYPTGVVKINKQCGFTAFFPGGEGIWKQNQNQNQNQKSKIPTIMVIGQDFSTVNKYILMLAGKANDIDSSTWRNLIKLFNQSGIDLEDCFFTNVFMGLRQSKSMVGEFPGYKDIEFRKRSIEYLKFQIEIVKPRAIITLGKYAAELLACTTDDLKAWRNWAALKQPDIGLVKNITIGKHKYNCVALEHPSMRNSNVKRRIYLNKTGNDAEIAMLNNLL